jgi:hypothetical protein
MDKTTKVMSAANILPGDVVEGFAVVSVHIGPANFRGSRKVVATGPSGETKVMSDAGRFSVTRAH